MSTLEPMEDEVDRLIEAWRRERPDLDVAPMEVLSRVSRLARHLDRARSQAFDTHGLESWSSTSSQHSAERARRTNCPPAGCSRKPWSRPAR